MSENNDYVMYPRDFEEKVFKALKEAYPIPSALDNQVSIPKQTVKRRQKRPDGVLSAPEERMQNIAKLALYFAQIGAFNDELQVKGRDGNFVENTNVADFFRYATQKTKSLANIDLYVYHLAQIEKDLGDIIKNVVLKAYLTRELTGHPDGLMKHENPMDLTTPKTVDQTPQSPDQSHEIPSIAGPSGIKRKLSEDYEELLDLDFLTEPPRKEQKIDGEFSEWNKLPDLKNDISKYLESLN